MSDPMPLKGAPTLTVLVLAPQFPAINQPWVDTYIEQLFNNGIDCRVFTFKRGALVYPQKLERFQIREKVKVLRDSRWSLLLGVIRTAFSRPRTSYYVARQLIDSLSMGESGRVHVLRRIVRTLSALDLLRSVPECEVVHSHDEAMTSWFAEAVHISGKSLVLTFHGLPPAGVPAIDACRRTQISDVAEVVLVNTQFARRHAIELAYASAKLEVLPQGLPLTEFPFASSRHDAADARIFVLTVGRFHRDKGQRFALLALARLLREDLPIFWHFVGVGQDKEHLEHLAKKLGISSAVRFHTGLPADSLKELYRQCHLFVLPSVGNRRGNEHVETQGVVVQEAQASGCIPIATEVGGIPECINHGSDGWLVRERSHRDIAETIKTALEQRDQWAKIRQAGRDNVESRFSADDVGKQMAEILRSAGARAAK